ncbi:DUF397 domain-containing protein [Allosalinactinospora lopnorensis]|uniref:DUF397 domain-containing protein n=1 Tax=Allosalinactinospora lopnorensis TaxID=1352348 RepID=UPI000623E264|nr:DUF397 domain-containing protein [Allosalinactinospora lopnorensis]
MELKWRKSSYSGQHGGNCVEVAEAPPTVLIRDTQHRASGHLSFPIEAWTAFLRNVKADRT